ncbi:hypothetical protein FJT64_022708 [Amphibalanus amphitrite]|uniref:Integrase zinc-binding domain-containing protein n=1 Tax=Amphibalanus amphitrite TaxID=1232801 RepID=A0A6A4WI13_AMPAM|nr:hypothetical protein FJT64_022708 [Amphibalanus amphitrite]
MRLADTMSRLSVPDEAENRLSAEEEAAYGGGGVMFIAEQGPCLTAQQIAVATRRDPVLARALAAVRSGWPAVVDPDLAPFKNRREELTTEADCLLWGGRVVIPSNLRDTVKRELHEGHFGCTRMKQLARRFDDPTQPLTKPRPSLWCRLKVRRMDGSGTPHTGPKHRRFVMDIVKDNKKWSRRTILTVSWEWEHLDVYLCGQGVLCVTPVYTQIVGM